MLIYKIIKIGLLIVFSCFTYADTVKGASERTLDLIRRMTFEEKLALSAGWNRFLVAGVERLGIRPVSMADASQGVRLQTALVKDKSTSFPGMLPLASTWNVSLAESFGSSIGEECHALGVDILLGPGVNMQRLSVGGRNFEYMGEDPLLTARIPTSYIKGLQDQGIVAVPKHFIGNDQDFCRHIANINMDERTLRDLYRLIAESKGISLNYELPDALIAFADIHLLETSIRNLINNAIKFTRGGGTILVKTSQHNNVIIVSVIDSGTDG